MNKRIKQNIQSTKHPSSEALCTENSHYGECVVHQHHVTQQASRLEFIAASLLNHTETMDQRVQDICSSFLQIAKLLQKQQSDASEQANGATICNQSNEQEDPETSVAEEVMQLVVRFQFHDALYQGLNRLISDIRDIECSLLQMIGQTANKPGRTDLTEKAAAALSDPTGRSSTVEDTNEDSILFF